MMSLVHVAFEYEPGREILSDVNVALPHGSFHFLTGPSGAGKTSLMKLMGLSARPKRGHIIVDTTDLTHLPRERWPGFRRKIGVVSQEWALIPHMSIAENIALPLKVAGESRETIRTKVAEMLDWIGLSHAAAAPPRALSGGEQQRVAIARAVITRPEIILADEPTGNLDPYLAHRVIYLFEALNQMGTTVLIATHDEHLISLFHYPVLKLESGRVEAA